MDMDAAESYYRDNLKTLGWNFANSRWAGLEFTKDKRTLLVTIAPTTDAQNWIVTLVVVPQIGG